MKRIYVYILLGIAFLARVVLIPNPGFEADVSFWKSWGLATLDLGVIKGLPLTNFNYPTPFAYFLGFMVWIYSLFANPHNFNEFWQNTNLLFLTISKIFPILADFGIAGIFFYIGKHAKKLGFPLVPTSVFYVLAFTYLFNPLSLFDGALWGQIDSVGVFLFLCALLALLRRLPFVAGLIFMIAMMTKLQNMIYGPIFFLFAWQTLGTAGLVRTIAGAFAGFIGLNIEFILARQSWRIMESITGNYDYFPWLSLNAYNPWWIFSGANGQQISDKVAAIGLLNEKTVGLFAFSSLYLFTVLRQFFDKKTVVRSFLESLILINASFFLFQTQSHERYAFPLSVFLLLWLPFIKNIKLFAMLYSLFTIVYFYNLHTALIVNYPLNGIALLNGLNIPWLTIAASITLTALFVVLVAYLIRASRVTRTIAFATCIVFFMLIGVGNLPLITKKPIPLGKIKPIKSVTGYGGRQVNMPVMASFGFDKWSPLSVQYAFYKTGIGTHAPASDTYDINRKFKTLTTDYGIDTNGGPQGSVVFEVYGDSRLLFRSDVVKRFDLPRHAQIDIAGVKILELVVTDAGDGKTDDHADWLNTYLHP